MGKKRVAVTIPEETYNQSAKDNGAKIRFYTKTATDHKQVIIEGKRPSGAKWKLICDEEMVDVLTALNNAGISTLWSCQGRGYRDVGDQRIFDPGYITIRYPKTQSLFVLAGTIIQHHFKKSIITRRIDDVGRVSFSIYDTKKYDISAGAIARQMVHSKANAIWDDIYVMDN